MYAKYHFLLKIKRSGVHQINELQKKYWEFYYIYWQLWNHSQKFFKYLRMSVETSDFLLSRVSHRLNKQPTNNRQSISHAERLLVAIQWDSKGIFCPLKSLDRIRDPPILLLNGYLWVLLLCRWIFDVKIIHNTVHEMFIIFCTLKIPYILYVYGLCHIFFSFWHTYGSMECVHECKFLTDDCTQA